MTYAVTLRDQPGRLTVSIAVDAPTADEAIELAYDLARVARMATAERHPLCVIAYAEQRR